jgi:hypothetical protein
VDGTDGGLAAEDGATVGLDFARIRSLTGQIVESLPIDGAAVAVRAGPDTGQLVHATDAIIARLDDLQFTLGEGPCVDAFRQQLPVLVPDLNDPDSLQRWPGFAREAAQAAAAAVFAFPMQIGAVAFGTVELYRRTAGSLTSIDTATAVLLVEEMTHVVLDELSSLNGLEVTAGHPEPIFGQPEIPQAAGMIAVQLGITVPHATAHLRAAAFAARRPVLHVAQDVIARRVTFAGTQ